MVSNVAQLNVNLKQETPVASITFLVLEILIIFHFTEYFFLLTVLGSCSQFT